MKTILLYYSKYKTTAQYAQWISEDLDCDLYPIDKAPDSLEAYDCILYGAGIYAGKLKEASLLEEYPEKKRIVFTVGLISQDHKNYKETLKRNFSEESLEKIKFFHFPGALDFKKLSLLDQILMRGVKLAFNKVPEEERDEDFQYMMDHYYESYGKLYKESIKPLLEEARRS